MVKKGANVNVKNNIAETPLFFAISNENTSLVMFLLEHGATGIQKENSWGDSPLLLAKENAQYEQNPQKREEWRKVINMMKEKIKE